MEKSKSGFLSIVVMACIIIAMLSAFLGAGGTGDAKYFIGWIENAQKYGVIDGFRENYDMYPPYSSLVLYCAFKVFSSFQGAPLFAIRITTAIFMILSCIAARVIFKNERMVYLLFFTTLLSVTNGYLDIFIVPFALIAFYMFKNNKYMLGGFFLALMCLMKYQPLIIMPIVAAGFVEIGIKGRQTKIEFNKLLSTGIGSLIPLIVTFAIYKKPFLWSIWVALFRDSNSIAPNGLNFGWLVQFVYEFATGNLENNTVSIMWSVPFKELILSKYIFVFGYIAVFVKTLFTKNKTLADILSNCLVVYTLYYLFNTNVHENHYFVGVILSLLLFYEKGEKYLIYVIMTAYMFGANVAVFYGIVGNNGIFNRVILGVVDPTIIMATVNVILGIIIIFTLMKIPDVFNDYNSTNG